MADYRTSWQCLRDADTERQRAELHQAAKDMNNAYTAAAYAQQRARLALSDARRGTTATSASSLLNWQARV